MVPSGNALVGIADRAGYPVLTVPAGYGTGGAGRNPIGVTFVGAAFSEADAARRGLRLRAGDERAARAELHEPEHVALRAGQHVLLAAPLPPGRPAERHGANGPTETPVARRRRRHGAGHALAHARHGRRRSARSRRASARTYTASTTATVISTAGDARADASPTRARVATGRLVNGAFALAQPLQGLGVVKTYAGPVSNDPVTVPFAQTIARTEPLRTGAYSKTLTFTLSTTSP